MPGTRFTPSMQKFIDSTRETLKIGHHPVTATALEAFALRTGISFVDLAKAVTEGISPPNQLSAKCIRSIETKAIAHAIKKMPEYSKLGEKAVLRVAWAKKRGFKDDADYRDYMKRQRRRIELISNIIPLMKEGVPAEKAADIAREVTGHMHKTTDKDVENASKIMKRSRLLRR